MKITVTQQEANAIGQVLDDSLKYAGIQRLDVINLIRSAIKLDDDTEVNLTDELKEPTDA